MMLEKNAMDYLKSKYSNLESVEYKYSHQYGWEYHIHFKSNGITKKVIIAQHALMTRLQEGI